LVKYTLWCLIDDLDLILTEGDKLNKSFNTNNYLSAHDLSLTIELGGFSSTVNFRELREVTLVQDFNCFSNCGRIEIKSLVSFFNLFKSLLKAIAIAFVP